MAEQSYRTKAAELATGTIHNASAPAPTAPEPANSGAGLCQDCGLAACGYVSGVKG